LFSFVAHVTATNQYTVASLHYGIAPSLILEKSKIGF
jgi:hypothetical protein